MEEKYCQSCAMPIEGNTEMYGTNLDGSKSDEYCSYCYQNGAFTSNTSMEEMVEFCIEPMVQNNADMTAEKAREMMMEFFPTLTRWKKA